MSAKGAPRWVESIADARKALGVNGFVRIEKGTPLYEKTSEIYQEKVKQHARAQQREEIEAQVGEQLQAVLADKSQEIVKAHADVQEASKQIDSIMTRSDFVAYLEKGLPKTAEEQEERNTIRTTLKSNAKRLLESIGCVFSSAKVPKSASACAEDQMTNFIDSEIQKLSFDIECLRAARCKISEQVNQLGEEIELDINTYVVTHKTIEKFVQKVCQEEQAEALELRDLYVQRRAELEKQCEAFVKANASATRDTAYAKVLEDLRSINGEAGAVEVVETERKAMMKALLAVQEKLPIEPPPAKRRRWFFSSS